MRALHFFTFLVSSWKPGCALLTQQVPLDTRANGLRGPPEGFTGGPPIMLWESHANSHTNPGKASSGVPEERQGIIGQEHYGPSLTSLIAMLCCPGDTSNFFFNVTKPTMVPFHLHPTASAKTDAAVLVIPGGGLDFLAWEKEGTDIALWLNKIGVTAYVLKYRVPIRPWIKNEGSKMPWLSGAGVEDAMRAMSTIRYQAMTQPNLGIDPKKIGAIGFSAGGEITMQLYTNANKRAYEKRDEIDNVPFEPDFMMMIYSQGVAYLNMKKSYKIPAPPTFLAVAKNDQCENAGLVEMTAASLKAKGGLVDLSVYPDGFHGYGRCSIYTTMAKKWSVCSWPTKATDFIYKQVLKTETPPGMKASI